MPRAGLDRDAVVRRGLRVVDDRGAEALTLANVAALAGVAVPSLYKHVGSLGDLRERVAVLAVADVTGRARAAVGDGTGGEAARRFARAVRDFAKEHPGRYALAQPGVGAGEDLRAVATDFVELAADVLREPGAGREGDVDAVRALRAAVHGFVVLEQQGGFGLPDDVDASFEAMLDVLVGGFAARRAGPAR